MSRKLVPIHEAAEALGVSAQTLRRWEREGRLLPDERTAGAVLAAACRADRRGHPVGFAAPYRAELLGLTGDVGARLLLRRDAEHVVGVAIDDAGIFADVDTPQDLFSRSE